MPNQKFQMNSFMEQMGKARGLPFIRGGGTII